VTSNDAKKDGDLAAFGRAFCRNIPHNAALGLELVDFARSPGMVLMRLPFSPDLVGNPETGVLHGGVITALVDAACGAAVILGMNPLRPIATLDLRIDHLASVPPGESVSCRAHCVKVTRQVAFARATAFAHDEAEPVATVAATFMLFGSARPSGARAGTSEPRQ
jgi:uncharacterized protein (TIGR00369 family)